MSNRSEGLILDPKAIRRALTRIAHEIAERNAEDHLVRLVGVQRGGVYLAKRLATILQEIWGHEVPVGSVDINMHRDDLDQQLPAAMHPTEIPFDVADTTMVLIDDVLFTGRSTRAALDALIDFGRPKKIQLAVLIDRGHRELPIKADFVGKNVPTAMTERVNVCLSEDGGEDAVYLRKE